MTNGFLKKVCIGFALFLVIGCAPRYTWKADPVIQQVDNQTHTARIEPVGRYKNTIAGFRLTVNNKIGQDIEIIWNKTLYLHNEQTSGGFMYEGIVYADRNKPKALDIVFANRTFVKEIWPCNLVYYSKSITAQFSGWDHKSFPAGQNGVYLTLRVNGHEVHEKLLLDVTIVKE